MVSAATTAPLIGDPDVAYLRSLATTSQASHQPTPALVCTGKDLEKAVEGAASPFSAIFINPRLSAQMGIPLIRSIRSAQPNIPIFYIHDEPTLPFRDDALRSLTINRSFRKPMTYSQILHATAAAQLSFDSKEALAQAGRNQDALDVETSASEDEFVPILAAHFLAGSASYFDLYVRLPSKRFVKVLKAGDGFSRERLEKYLSKGVAHFYLRREAQEHYLRYCDRITTGLVAQTALPQDLRVAQVMNQGQETASLLKTAGIGNDLIHYAVKYSENLKTLVRTLNLERNDSIREYMKDMTLVEHGVATAMVASLLAVPLKFEGEKTIGLIGLAALFHDIGLQKLDPKFREPAGDDESGMSPMELERYHRHPIIGAEILSESREINPAAVQAVLQHHERRSRKGFPGRLGSGSINRIAEVIGISEEFVKLLHQQAAGRIKSPLAEMEARVFDGFSAQVIAAFRLFFSKGTSK
jgi:HD-GYP domain-containing protein (c-di-GMP phosphodiesterase class II)